jgi:hypothetical protein
MKFFVKIDRKSAHLAAAIAKLGSLVGAVCISLKELRNEQKSDRT